MLAALNEIDMFAANIVNAYLNAPCPEKICIEAGPDFGSQKGCVMLIVRSQYGLKSICSSWREMLSTTLVKDGLVYTSTAMYKDVWINMEVLPDGK